MGIANPRILAATTIDFGYRRQHANEAIRRRRSVVWHANTLFGRELLHNSESRFMKAAYIEQTGPAENIIYGELPTPEPQQGQVLVKVGAVSVNPVDTYIRNGANYWELPQPFIIGCDLAGVVEAVGAGAERFQVGDRVWGTNQGLVGRQGTFAEYCAVDEQWLYSTPDGVSERHCRRVGAGRCHGPFGAFSRSAIVRRRVDLRTRWIRRCRFDGRANGQGGWCAGHRYRR